MRIESLLQKEINLMMLTIPIFIIFDLNIIISESANNKMEIPELSSNLINVDEDLMKLLKLK